MRPGTETPLALSSKLALTGRGTRSLPASAGRETLIGIGSQLLKVTEFLKHNAGAIGHGAQRIIGAVTLDLEAGQEVVLHKGPLRAAVTAKMAAAMAAASAPVITNHRLKRCSRS